MGWNMAIEIKSTPPLEGKVAEDFVKKAEASIEARGTINFSQQAESANNILGKGKMEYKGKVYAKIGGKYIACTETVADLENRIKELESQLEDKNK